MRLAQLVERIAHRIDTLARLAEVAEQGVDVVARGHHVERRVDREHDGLDLPRFDRGAGDVRVVGRQPDVADHAGLFAAAHVLEELALHAGIEFLQVVDIVQHAQIEVVHAQAAQLVFERGHRLREVATALVLPVDPAGAEVALHDPLVGMAFHGVAQVVADQRVGHPAVEQVHSALAARLGDRARFLGRPLHPLGPEPDFAHAQTRRAQFTVFHDCHLSLGKRDARDARPSSA